MSTNGTKTVKGRISNKHGTEEYWILSVYTDTSKNTLRENPFYPLDGELIVYDPDSTYNYPRFKFGNGNSNVHDLPFVGEAERAALEGKLAEKSHKHGNITNDGKLPTAGRVVVTNSSGQITTSSSVDNTKLGYLQDVTSNIQAQLDNKAASSHNQASDTITAMTGYSKDAAGGSILAADSLNTAVGKLEKNIEVSYDKIISRGEQLIVNGNAQLGNNTNFTSWAYDGAVANNSPGSFTRPFAATGSPTTNEYFPVNPVKTYRVNIDAKSQEGLSTLLAFTAFYDIDKKQISSIYFIHNTASTTTLARDLVAGDTEIQLTDVSGWSTSFGYGFHAIVWNYTNSKGYTYPAGTYSRNRITLPRENNKLPASAINTTNKTIQLAAAYSGTTIPAGTPISQGGEGATYKYIAWENHVVPTTWQTRTGTIGGVDLSGTNKVGMFPPGTAYCKLGFLWNYNKAQDQIWITNIEMFDTLYASKTAASGGTDLSVVTTGEKYTWNNKISSITASAGTNINKVGIPSVTASTSNNATTLTFNYLKGETGEKGDSVTITNLSESTAAGGTSTITFSDGKTLNIKNGTNGSNANVTKANVEAVLTGEIDSHSHKWPNPIDYYWANVKISSSSSNTTVPKFGGAAIDGGTLYVKGTTGHREGIRISQYGGLSSIWWNAEGEKDYTTGNMWGITAYSTAYTSNTTKTNTFRFRGPASSTATAATDQMWINTSGLVTSRGGFAKSGGTSSQFLKADGSVDNNTYLTSANLSGYATETWVTNKGYTTNTGTVTSVGLSAPTGFSVSNSPVTGSGTLTLSFADGYSIPTTAKQGNWDTAYGWGDHSTQGYLTSQSLANYVTLNTDQEITAKKTLISTGSTQKVEVSNTQVRLADGNNGFNLQYDNTKKAIKFVFN